MKQTIPLLKFSSNNSTTKENIIILLSQNWPLNLKEIFSGVQKHGSNDVTYQAVHKAVTQLEEDGVIEKTGKTIQLKKNWIEKSKQFFSNLSSAYTNSKGKYKLDPNFKETIALKFDDISLFTITVAEWFANKTFIKEGNPAPYGIFRHAWWPTRFNFSDFHLLLKVLKNNFLDNKGGYVVTRKSSHFDEWILSQYLQGGFRGCKTGIEISGLKDDFFIHGDVIFQTSLSDETNKLMDDYYEKISDLQELFDFYKNGKKFPKTEIEVKIFRNLQLAEALRNIVKKQFGEEK